MVERAEVAAEGEEERDKRRRDLLASRRARPTQPTQVELEEHEQAGHKQNRSWCCASLGRTDAHATRPAEQGGMPVIGVDYGCFWNRAAESVDGERDEILGEEPTDEVRRSSLVLCGRCTVQTGGSSAISVRQKVTTRESDGQPPNLKPHTSRACSHCSGRSAFGSGARTSQQRTESRNRTG